MKNIAEKHKKQLLNDKNTDRTNAITATFAEYLNE